MLSQFKSQMLALSRKSYCRSGGEGSEEGNRSRALPSEKAGLAFQSDESRLMPMLLQLIGFSRSEFGGGAGFRFDGVQAILTALRTLAGHAVGGNGSHWGFGNLYDRVTAFHGLHGVFGFDARGRDCKSRVVDSLGPSEAWVGLEAGSAQNFGGMLRTLSRGVLQGLVRGLRSNSGLEHHDLLSCRDAMRPGRFRAWLISPVCHAVGRGMGKDISCLEFSGIKNLKIQLSAHPAFARGMMHERYSNKKSRIFLSRLALLYFASAPLIALWTSTTAIAEETVVPPCSSTPRTGPVNLTKDGSEEEVCFNAVKDNSVTKNPKVTIKTNWQGKYSGNNITDLIIVALKSGVESVSNSGTTWNLYGGDDIIKGSGKILATINLGAGDDEIGNSHLDADSADNGLKLETVSLGSGNNTVTAVSAASITAGIGNDTVNLAESAGTIELGDGENVINARRAGSISLGKNDDTVTLTQAIDKDKEKIITESVILGHGNNILTAVNVEEISGGNQNDTITLSGDAWNVDLGGGTNKLEAANLVEKYSGGDGFDTVLLSGDAGGEIDLGSGETSNSVIVNGNITGDVASTAAGKLNSAEIWDNVTIGGGVGNVRLGGGNNKLTVLGNWEGIYTDGSGSDIIIVGKNGVVSEDLDLLFGSNVVKGSGEISREITFGKGDDFIGENPSGLTLYQKSKVNGLALSGEVDLGGGSNRVHADTISKQILGGTGKDDVFINRGAGDVNLKDGVNGMTISEKGLWSGVYTGGNGIDTITVSSGATAQAKDAESFWKLKNGDDVIKGSGTIFANLNLGLGHDRIGYLPATNDLMEFRALTLAGSVDLGAGNDIVIASKLLNITAGDGNDKIYLFPESSFTVGDLNLGGGDDTFRLFGGLNNINSKKVELPLFGSQTGASNTLELCNALGANGECGTTIQNNANYAFNAVLGPGKGNAKTWEFINVKNQESGTQSLLTITNNITLNTARLMDMKISADGSTGDQITIGGKISIMPFHSDHTKLFATRTNSGRESLGTLFELDFDPGSSSSDSLIFGSGSTAGIGHKSETISIDLKVPESYTHQVAKDTTIQIVTVHDNSAVKDVILQGTLPRQLYINGQEWVLEKADSGENTIYRLKANLTQAVTSVGGSDDSLNQKTSEKPSDVRILSSWDGNYQGGKESDTIFVKSGVIASGSYWRLNQGNDVIMGSGEIQSYIMMGDGDDRIGNLSRNANSKTDNRLTLSGSVSLGNGSNVLIADSAQNIYAGDGDDTVILEKGAKTVRLGDGENRVAADSVRGVYGGDGNDIFILRGEADRVKLGNGKNSLRVSKVRLLDGGSGDDTVILNPNSSFSVTKLKLGYGANTLKIVGRSNAITDLTDRKVTLDLSDGPAPKDEKKDIDSLYICNEINFKDECTDVLSKSDYSFNVVLDATGSRGNTWENVYIESQASAVRSVLEVKGDITFKGAKLNSFLFAANGKAGDKIKFDGKIAVQDTSYEAHNFSATGVEIDLNPATLVSDILEFTENTHNFIGQPNLSVSLPVAVKVNRSGTVTRTFPPAKVKFARVRPGSAVADIIVQGDLGKKIILNDQEWGITTEMASDGTKEYFLTAGAILQSLNATGSEDVTRSGAGSNITRISGNWSGSYTGGSGIDIISVHLQDGHQTGGAGELWDLKGGHNVIRGRGDILSKVKFGDGNDTIGNFAFNASSSDNKLVFKEQISLGDGTNKVMASSVSNIIGGAHNDTVVLSGFAFGVINLKDGENEVHAEGAQGLETGDGNDTIFLSPRRSFEIEKLNLGRGNNKLTIAGGSIQKNQVVPPKVSLTLSEGSDSGENTLYICSEVNFLGTCIGKNDDHAFNISLDASGASGNMWDTITVKNSASTTQSFLEISGSVTLTDSEFNNLKFSGNGKSGDEILISGSFGITDSTIFELDFNPQAKNSQYSDLLTFNEGAKKMPHDHFISVPVVHIKASKSKADKNLKVLIARARPGAEVNGLKINGEVNNQITLNDQIWTIIGSVTDNGESELYLEITSFSPVSASPTGTFATGEHVLSAVSTVASLPVSIGAHLGGGIGGSTGISQDGRILKPVTLGTRFTAGREFGAEGNNSGDYQNSFWRVNSEVEFFSHESVETHTTHFLSLQHGLVESNNLLQSNLSGFGYGFHAVHQTGMHFGVSTSLNKIKTENLSSNGNFAQYTLEGMTVAAEIGQSGIIDGFLNSVYTFRIAQSNFGNVTLPGGAVLSDFRKFTGEISTLFDYNWDGLRNRESFRDFVLTVHGGMTVAHDFDAGYKVTQGEDSVLVDSGKDWVGIRAGVSLNFPTGNFFVEVSRDSVLGGLRAVKKAYTLGYELEW